MSEAVIVVAWFDPITSMLDLWCQWGRFFSEYSNFLQVVSVHRLEESAEKLKYMVMSQDQNAVQNSNIKIGNKIVWRVEQFIYLRTTLMNRNPTHEEIKNRLSYGSACYLVVQNILSTSLVSKNIKTKIYRTVILPVVLYGCETIGHIKGET